MFNLHKDRPSVLVAETFSEREGIHYVTHARGLLSAIRADLFVLGGLVFQGFIYSAKTQVENKTHSVI